MADIRDTSYASTYALVRHLVLKLQEYHFVNVYQSVPDAAEQLAAPPKSNPAKSNANGKNLAADGDSDVAHLRTSKLLLSDKKRLVQLFGYFQLLNSSSKSFELSCRRNWRGYLCQS